jgi:hypothetical protein
MMIQSAGDVYNLHETAYNEQITALDSLLTTNEETLNTALNIDTGIDSMVDAIASLKNEIALLRGDTAKATEVATNAARDARDSSDNLDKIANSVTIVEISA